jgi:large subunit ribosomal protein L21e
MKHSVGYRNRTRTLLKKKPRERGLSPINRILRVYEAGEKVVVKIDPSASSRACPTGGSTGKTATSIERRGRAYVCQGPHGGFEKVIIVRPEHIKPLRQSEWPRIAFARRRRPSPKVKMLLEQR